jgi:hypothetical protein
MKRCCAGVRTESDEATLFLGVPAEAGGVAAAGRAAAE